MVWEHNIEHMVFTNANQDTSKLYDADAEGERLAVLVAAVRCHHSIPRRRVHYRFCCSPRQGDAAFPAVVDTGPARVLLAAYRVRAPAAAARISSSSRRSRWSCLLFFASRRPSTTASIENRYLKLLLVLSLGVMLLAATALGRPCCGSLAPRGGAGAIGHVDDARRRRRGIGVEPLHRLA